MINNKNRIILLLFFFLILLSQANFALAADVTLTKEYTYHASDIDSKVSSRTIALEQVKRALLEEFGTYLISETSVNNYQLTKDQITTLTAGIVGAEIIDEKWDGQTYYLKARITTDPQEVAKSVEVLRNDKQRSVELEESQKRAKAALDEVAKLTKELDSLKIANQSNYATAIDALISENEYQKAEREKYREAMKGIASAHAREVTSILNNMRTDEDIAREQAEQKQRDEDSRKTKSGLGGFIRSLW